MNERIMHATRKVVEPGPVITISRECGCSASNLAEQLTNRINEKSSKQESKWRWVNKEILKLASDELKIHQDEVKKIVDSGEKNFLDEIVYSFTEKYYVTNLKAKKIIEEVVRNLAVRGKVIIVGRGSEILSHGIPHALHVRLYAPLDWKIKAMCERSNISESEAKKIVLLVDKQRAEFRDSYLEKNQPAFEYDIQFNCARLSQEEIIDIMLSIAERRLILT